MTDLLPPIEIRAEDEQLNKTIEWIITYFLLRKGQEFNLGEIRYDLYKYLINHPLLSNITTEGAKPSH